MTPSQTCIETRGSILKTVRIDNKHFAADYEVTDTRVTDNRPNLVEIGQLVARPYCGENLRFCDLYSPLFRFLIQPTERIYGLIRTFNGTNDVFRGLWWSFV